MTSRCNKIIFLDIPTKVKCEWSGIVFVSSVTGSAMPSDRHVRHSAIRNNHLRLFSSDVARQQLLNRVVCLWRGLAGKHSGGTIKVWTAKHIKPHLETCVLRVRNRVLSEEPKVWIAKHMKPHIETCVLRSRDRRDVTMIKNLHQTS